MNLEKTVIEELEELTKIELTSLLNSVYSFFELNSSQLLDYFSGQKGQIDPIIFTNFFKLESNFNSSINSIFEFRNRLYNTRFIELFEKLQILSDKLSYIRNLHRWSRSSVVNFSYQKDYQADYVLHEGDSLEKISRNLLRRDDFLDDWLDIALSNNLTEESYTGEGGELISLPISKRIISFSLDSVVDSISSDSCYGRDIPRKFSFKDEDVEVLTPQETIKQSVEILVTLRKGDNLEFINQGFQEEIFVGSNRSFFNTPVLIRQLVESFLTDDTLINFKVTEIKTEQDNFFLNFEVETILGEILNKSLRFNR